MRLKLYLEAKWLPLWFRGRARQDTKSAEGLRAVESLCETHAGEGDRLQADVGVTYEGIQHQIPNPGILEEQGKPL